MINVVTKAGNLSPYIKGTTQVVASGLRPTPTAVPTHAKIVTEPKSRTTTIQSLSDTLPSGHLRVKSGPGVSTQFVRYAHTDVSIPDFSHYRRPSTSNPNSTASRDSDESRKAFTYLIAAGGSIASVYTAKSLVHVLIKSMAASAEVLALAKIEVKLGDIPEGKSVTFKWRGKPLFIRHRSAAEISTEQAVAVSELRDPETDAVRVKDPAWLVVIGVCTHLGCVPIANAGEFGGYYCPCHGSHYDASGRIRKGPAPLNLEVPPYEVLDGTIIVG